MAEERIRRAPRTAGARVYVDGNTVRKEAYTEERQEESRRELSYQVRKNRERAKHMTVPYMMFLAAACVTVMVVCVAALMLQSQIIMVKRDIHNVQKEIDELKLENKAIEESMNLAVDLDYVYKMATKKVGMVYPTEDQVIWFDKTESEYVRQYEDIPITN